MKNITLAIDEGVLDQVRVYAAQHKTTVNGLVREFLQTLVPDETRLASVQSRLKDLMDNSTGRMSSAYVWNREELYEERLLPRHEHPDLRSDREEG